MRASWRIIWAPDEPTRFHSAETGLGSEVVVSSTTMHDGSLYFGTYNGGLACYAHGVWKSYHAGTSGLCSSSVWCLAGTPDHRLLMRYAGREVSQIFDPATGSLLPLIPATPSCLPIISAPSSCRMPIRRCWAIPSICRSSISRMARFRTWTIPWGESRLSVRPSTMPCSTVADFSGVATPSGIAMYDTHSDQMESVNELNGTLGAVGWCRHRG